MRRPTGWEFEVVYDASSGGKSGFFEQRLETDSVGFPTLPSRTRVINMLGRKLYWQNFFSRARHYDVLVTDTYVKHLTYVAAFAYRLAGQTRVFWGIPGDAQSVNPQGAKRLAEWFKKKLIFQADHFFAYTHGSRQALISLGYPAERVTVVPNTIDIEAERGQFLKFQSERDAIREQYGLAGDARVILYVGRLLRLKRIDFLLKCFEALQAQDPRYVLWIAGKGEEEQLVRDTATRLGERAMRYLGTLPDPDDVARVHVASDVYFLPGYVGLAPLQAFCYNLPVVWLQAQSHSPEVEYLNDRNGFMLPAGTLPKEVPELWERGLANFETVEGRSRIFETIRHLTIENMADGFIRGMNRVLGIEA
jgi:glycosyltransferase involved in cell wall biosynthesis